MLFLPWSAVLISCNHSIKRLISFTKKPFKSEISSFCIWTLHSVLYTLCSVQRVVTRESMSIVLPVRRLVRFEVAARHRKFIAKKFAPKENFF